MPQVAEKGPRHQLGWSAWKLPRAERALQGAPQSVFETIK